ncbi:MAG: HlyD family efflux transporter periplasmic adaptor subunit [Bacteroidetes bacterium]|nr:MAG: HlyD family efflux transporter periplasmic adaptor subunit [Bacteroidota bacterium]
MPQQNQTYSHDVQEIISYKPGFVIRYGMLAMLVIMLGILLVSWFVKYPDVVAAKATLSTLNAPKPVVARVQGKLVKLFANEGDSVEAGQVLGFVESIAKHEAVIHLGHQLETLHQAMLDSGLQVQMSFAPDAYANLGELQQAYQTFQLAWATYSNYTANGFYLTKKVLLDKDLAYIKKNHAQLWQQQTLTQQDVALAQQTFTANATLKSQQVISDFEFRNEQAKLIGKQLSLPQLSASIIGNEAQQNEKQKEIAELKNTIAQQRRVFLQALQSFMSQVADWKMKYLLTAPVAGKVSFAGFVQENEELVLNKTICFVAPVNTQYFAEMYIPQANFGKVKIGQQVLLKFMAYPYQQFGSISAHIQFISTLPTDSGYLAKLSLPTPLTTSRQTVLPFRQGLQAQGEIITTDRRLLTRFYEDLVGPMRR